MGNTNKLKNRKIVRKGKFSIDDNKDNSNNNNYNNNGTANTKMITMKSTKHIMFQNLTSKL